MARKAKPSGRVNKGPWTPDEIIRALQREGWDGKRAPHTQLEHPTRPGKITVDTGWTGGIKASHDVFAWMAAQGGYSKRELIRIINAD